MTKVFIEPVASASDFSRFIDENDFGFDSGEFWDGMDMWQEGSLSSRFTPDWCQRVISGGDEFRKIHGTYWDKKRRFYPAILKLLQDYKLESIRFACDW